MGDWNISWSRELSQILMEEWYEGEWKSWEKNGQGTYVFSMETNM